MGLDLLLQETKGLSEESLIEAVRLASINDTSTNGKEKIRSAGKYRCNGWMADDFDAPLNDFKEYMKLFLIMNNIVLQERLLDYLTPLVFIFKVSIFA